MASLEETVSSHVCRSLQEVKPSHHRGKKSQYCGNGCLWILRPLDPSAKSEILEEIRKGLLKIFVWRGNCYYKVTVPFPPHTCAHKRWKD